MTQNKKYNLQRLLEMRERARDDSAYYLNECRQNLANAENELKTRKKAVEICRKRQDLLQKQLHEKSRNGIKSSEILSFSQHLKDLRGEEEKLLNAVEDQKQVVERAEKTVEKAIELLNEAAKEVKVIEKHRENWNNEKRTESARRENKQNDEIGAILHERQKFD